MGWKQANLMYFTDPGDLSPSVNHAAADALVAAAAGVWNVPVASITVSQGGQLAEHVSSANTYLSNSGVVWPADVMSSNAPAIPLAIVYDTDGSVTDTLLGAGASDPRGCGQNGVTETVDLFEPAGYIAHAILIVNGRCTGSAPQMQLQLQYQLERIFGRVLGLAWSQTNDNVFTGTPQPTYNQALNWPIMHPLDLFCGPYSYQCLPDPFTLRPDDIAGLVGIYPIPSGETPATGKQQSLQAANQLNGYVTFPSGEGMEGVNVLVTQSPRFSSTPEGWATTSAITGSSFVRSGLSPFVSADTSALGSMGTSSASASGYYVVPYFAITDPSGYQNDTVTTEPVNQLYIGSASVGPYAAGMVSPAGSAPQPYLWLSVYPNSEWTQSFPIADAPVACGNGADGTRVAPMQAPASGWWNGLLCGYGHASYAAAAIQAGRSLTVEVTALDGNGFATTSKAMPVIGLFAPTDSVVGLPSLGATEQAFQALGVGTTTLNAEPFAAGTQGGTVQVGIADQRGDGRPDFNYQARLFYADRLSVSDVPVGGGSVTISGMGFRAGNEVTVNGVVANATSWTSSEIVFTAPSLADAGASAGTPVDVDVLDLGTGATSTMTGVLTYDAAALPDAMELISAPASPVFTGTPAAVPFAVQVVAGDGVTPLAGQTVMFSATLGSVQFGACGAATCNVVTDANGMASTAVTPTGAGSVTIQAADGGLLQTANFSAQTSPASIKVLSAPSGSVPVGAVAAAPFRVELLKADGRTAIPGELVTFSVTAGAATFSGCNAAPCSVVTNSSGQASVAVTPTAAGAITLQAADGGLVQTASFSGISTPDILTLTQVPNATGYVDQQVGQIGARLTLPDGVTPVQYVPVQLSAPPGILFTQCLSNVCTLDTDYFGGIGTNVEATQTGTFTLEVSYGALSQTTTVTVGQRTMQLSVITAPSGSLPVDVQAAVPFSAQLLDDYGNPAAGQQVVLGGSLADVSLNCKSVGSCVLTTDENGMVSALVTPLVPGTIVLTAVYGSLQASASFTAVGPGASLTVTAAPPAQVPVGTTVHFTLLALAADGVTPVANTAAWATLVSGSFAFNGCQTGFCKFYTNAQGVVDISGASFTQGMVTLSVTVGVLTQSTTFTVVPIVDVMNVVTAPTGSVIVGSAASAPFAVQVTTAGNGSPVSGQNVTFSLAPQSTAGVKIGACAALPCVVVTNANGIASTGAITTLATGAVTLVATDNALLQSASFTVTPQPDLVSLTSRPGNVFQGATSAAPLTVQVTLADGVTPAADVPVILSVASGAGAVNYAACGNPICTVATNAAGEVSTLVTGTQVGAVTLNATVQVPTGNLMLSATLQVIANVRSVTALEPTTYLAAGATAELELDVNAMQNGSPAAGQTIAWTGGTGIAFDSATSTTDALGDAAVQATLGPLASGTPAVATGCGWGTVCGQFTVTPVAPELWQIAIVSGGLQEATGGAALNPVVAQVTDGAGHPLLGATVTVGQTVRALVVCPPTGRCPTAPVLDAGSVVVISDATGDVSVPPLVVPGTATTTSLAFSTGIQGFATTTVSSSP